MSAWMTQQREAFARAARRLAAAPGATLLATLSIAIALALPAGGQLLISSLQAFGQVDTVTPQISVFMALDANDKASDQVKAQLTANDAIAGVQFVSREDTLKRLRAKGLAQIIDSLLGNPFPDTFIVTPKDTTPTALETLRADLAKLPHVDTVQVDSAWAKRLALMLSLGHKAVWVIATLFGVGLVALMFNTIHLQALTQREEIEVSKLLGATDAYIGRPFYYFGALQGLLGGIVACGIVYAAVAVLQKPVANLAALYNIDFGLRSPRPLEALALLLISAALGWLGAALSVRRHLAA